MTNQQALDLIKQHLASGKTPDEVKQTMLAAGFTAADIEEGLKIAAEPQIPGSTPHTALPSAQGQLPSAQELLRQAWEFYKKYFSLLVPIYAIPYAVTLVFVLLSSGIKHGGSLAAGLIGLSVIVWVLMVIMWIWAEAAILFAIKDPEPNMNVSAALTKGRAKIWPMFITGLLSGLAVLGGFILLIIPGIIFALWFSQSAYIVVSEDLEGTKALSQSKKYVSGRLGAVFWRGFVLVVISIIISAVINSIAGAIFGSQGTQSEVERALVNGIVTVFWAPFATVYGYKLYTYLKR